MPLFERNLQSADEPKVSMTAAQPISMRTSSICAGRAMLRGIVPASGGALPMFPSLDEIDPGFALAHAGFAGRSPTTFSGVPLRDAAEIAEALRASTRAEELRSPGLAEVMVARGTLLSAQNLDDEATAAYEEALDVADLPDVCSYARHAFSASDFSKAARLFERNVELDPTNFTACGPVRAGVVIRLATACAAAGV